MYRKYLFIIIKLLKNIHLVTQSLSVFVYILIGVQEVRIGGVQRLLL